MSLGRRKRLAPNAVVRGSDFNALLDLVEANQNLRVGPGLQMYRTSAGTFIASMNRPEPPIAGTKKAEPDDGPFMATFPAVILDSLGWQDSSSDPDAMPPANKYVWRYLVHMCSWEREGERTLIPIDGWIASSGAEGFFYPMPWELGGGGWCFLRDDEYYMSGGFIKNGVSIRGWGWNLVEQYNNGLANYAQGNGVDIKGLQVANPHLNIQPVPIGTVVICHAMGSADNYSIFFTYENGIDGTCGP